MHSTTGNRKLIIRISIVTQRFISIDIISLDAQQLIHDEGRNLFIDAKDELRVRTLELRVRTLELRVRTLELRVRTLELRVRTLELRVRTLELRVRTLELTAS
jgi:hypothetical protein